MVVYWYYKNYHGTLLSKLNTKIFFRDGRVSIPLIGIGMIPGFISRYCSSRLLVAACVTIRELKACESDRWPLRCNFCANSDRNRNMNIINGVNKAQSFHFLFSNINFNDPKEWKKFHLWSHDFYWCFRLCSGIISVSLASYLMQESNPIHNFAIVTRLI